MISEETWGDAAVDIYADVKEVPQNTSFAGEVDSLLKNGSGTR